jgi:transposase InsO family protein
VQLALDEPALSPRELAVRFTDTEKYFVSEASVYRLLKAHDLIASPAFIVMKAADEFKDKTTAPNQLWQTDFTYLKVIGWGWFYLSTILDDFSRYIIAWKLCTTMKVEDVTATLDLALKASGLDQATVIHRPRLLSDNGSSYISADLAKWLGGQNMEHVRGAPYHPMTQGKIERWHQTLKNRILLENYYLPGDLEAQIAAFVADYNHLRYHESIANLTPADVYFGRGQTLLIERERIKRQTIANRRLLHIGRPHNITNQTSQRLSYFKPLPVPKTLTTDSAQLPRSFQTDASSDFGGYGSGEPSNGESIRHRSKDSFPAALGEFLDLSILGRILFAEEFHVPFEPRDVFFQNAGSRRVLSRHVGTCRFFLSLLHMAQICGDICRDRSRLVGDCSCILPLLVAWQRLMIMCRVLSRHVAAGRLGKLRDLRNVPRDGCGCDHIFFAERSLLP